MAWRRLSDTGWNELVIYELHIGTFHRPDDEQPATFADAIEKFAHLKRLGVNALQIMPAMEFAGDISWGYNPAHIFAIESAYGGPDGFKDFVEAAHREGFAVILDVVYNHFGPSDLDLWQFDGWSENDKGGIYFYNDWRSETPWGDTRPDYGRGEVRQFIRDNALYWLEESHDEVANGKARVPHEIAPGDPSHWAAQKRSTLGAALMFTAPGIPMLFQGQEFLQGEWFQDTVPLDWDQTDEFHGIVRLYRDLIRLRLNSRGATRGLCGRGIKIHRVDEERKLVAFHRWDQGGPGDDVVVVASFSHEGREVYRIGFPHEGLWKLRLNTDWRGYSDDFGDFSSHEVTAEPGECDGMPFSAEIAIGPYSALVYSQDR